RTMNIEQLEYFITLVEEENFLEASEKLYISQSSLSKNIKKMELELDISLFDRSSRKATLTEAGKEFYLESKKILDSYKKAIKNLDKFKAVDSIKIGVLPVFNQYNLNLIFQKFKLDYPSIKLIIEEDEEGNLIKNESYDFIIARDSINDLFLGCVKIAEDKLVGVVSAQNPLSQNSNIKFENLKNENLLLMKNYTTVYKMIINEFEKLGIEPKILRTGRVESLISSLVFENAVALLPFNSYKILEREQLRVVPIEPTFNLPISLMKNKTRKYTENMKIFLSFLEDFISKI
ncbi:MAG: LysR family transcriptional regulator, partial [Cetobacterium sp.]